MKQYLFYGCTDRYSRGPMEILKSINVRDDESAPQAERNAADHNEHYLRYFAQGEYSALYVLVLNLNPATGVTEVLRNEYSENPLKVRTEINAAAKKTMATKKPFNMTDFVEFPTTTAENNV